MKVLLVNPPHSFSPGNPLGRAGLSLPPLGLLGVAAWLREGLPGAEVKVTDMPASRVSPEVFEADVAAFAPDLAGVSVYTGTFSASCAAAAAIKRAAPGCLVAAGGHHATALPDQCLERGFDAVVVGEGEKPFLELARAVAAGRRPVPGPGLATAPGQSVPRPDPVPPDRLPFPARDLVDLSLYRPAIFGYRNLPVTSMVTSRGCPYSCGFCSKAVFGSAYRAQSPARVLAEVRELRERYGIREITFQDDTFTAMRGRVMEICGLLREREPGLTWSCMTRVDLVDPELLSAMASAGCFSVAFGIDGASDEACGLMGKGFRPERARAAVAAARAAGLETRGYYVLGYPGETPQTLRAAVRRAAEIDTDHVFFAFAHPFFGTDLYREARARGLLDATDEELLDAHDNAVPLVKVPGMTRTELERFYRGAYMRYYLRPASLRRRLGSVRALADSFRALGCLARWRL